MPSRRANLPIDVVADRYKQGESLQDLGIAYNVSADTIKAHLVRHGVTLRTHKEAMSQDIVRATIARNATGRSAWNAGLTKDSDDRVAQYAKKILGGTRTPESIERMRASKQKHPWYEVCQECGSAKGYNRSSRCTKCAAAYRAKTYPNSMKGKKLKPGHWERMMRGQKRGTKTKPEQAVERAISNIFGSCLVYEYTGSGRFFVTFKNGKRKIPDFVSHHERKVIEVYGRYWHRNDDPADIIRQYKEIDWDCLVLWEEEAYQNIYDSILFFTYPYDFDRHEAMY
jgi:hypothetical protein